MRLIDADAIVLDYGGLAKIHPHDCRGIAEYFAKQIDAMPTIEPERKGKWIKMSDADGEYFACSVCGGELQRILLSKPTWDKPYPDMVSCDPTDFCPNCGADLREGAEQE